VTGGEEIEGIEENTLLECRVVFVDRLRHAGNVLDVDQTRVSFADLCCFGLWFIFAFFLEL
jgi:hypothetical protein